MAQGNQLQKYVWQPRNKLYEIQNKYFILDFQLITF